MKLETGLRSLRQPLRKRKEPRDPHRRADKIGSRTRGQVQGIGGGGTWKKQRGLYEARDRAVRETHGKRRAGPGQAPKGNREPGQAARQEPVKIRAQGQGNREGA